MLRSLVTQTTTRLGRKGTKEIRRYHHFCVGNKRDAIANGTFNKHICYRSLSSTTLASCAETTTMATGKDEISSVAARLAVVTVFSLLAGNGSLTLAEEGGESLSEEDKMYADWDEFMIKSISPGEDDDEDDDDDEDEDDDDEEESEDEDDDDTASGPADETEDITNGDPIIEANGAADGDTSNNDAQEDIPDSVDSTSSLEGEQPQGPADEDEDSGLGYDATKEDEEDKYKHLESEDVEDEPTTCTICLINRQGPCRPLWRKFEHCMKDHGDSNNGNGENKDASPVAGGGTLAQMCDKYMLPWLHCIQNHRNTYTLITNGFYREEFVDPMELAVKDENKSLFVEDVGTGDEDNRNGIDVDLTHWWEYVDAKREKANEHILITNDDDDDEGEEDNEVEEEKRLEKELLEMAEEEAKEFLKEKGIDEPKSPEPEEDPFLVNVYAKFNLRDPSTDRLIDIAYIRDQDGRILGFDQFTKEKSPPAPEDEEKKEKGESGDAGKEDVHVEDEKDDGGGKTGNCMFHIRPGETTSIQLFALYRDGNNGNDGVGDEDDGVKSAKLEETLYYSAPISLEQRPPSE